MSAPRILIVFCCLTAGGCAAFNASESPPRTVLPAPEGKKLAELVGAAFKTAKLPGAPEVSPVRHTHDTQQGDWIFCIKSDKSAESPKYAVLIGNNTILEVRSSVLIDGCNDETYHAIETADQHSGLAGSHSDSTPQFQRRR
jgi:hypothetical protein